MINAPAKRCTDSISAVAAPGSSCRPNDLGQCRQGPARFAERIAQINIGAFVETDTICFTDPSRLPSIVVAHPLRRVRILRTSSRRSDRWDGRPEFMVAIMGGSGRRSITSVSSWSPWACPIS
jgi:hypothetical protein